MSTETNTLSRVEWGNGNQTLVFLHYFSGAAQSWQWVARQLPNYRCIAFNLPGFGGTPALQQPTIQRYAETISQAIAELELENYTLIGHSMGGKLALQVAATISQPPQRVVLIAPSPITTEPMPDEEKQRMLNNHPSPENARTTLKNATKQPLDDQQQALIIQTHQNVEQTAWRWWLLQGMNHSIADLVSQLQIPVTVLASKDDPVIPYNMIQTDVIDLLPNANLITIEGVGHLIPQEAPDWVAANISSL
ncbi:MAG: alpha/beta hydrolase [Microcoleaceae cyanobacterium]